MRQYKITSADFIKPGELLDPDAYLSPEDLVSLNQQCSGIVGVLKAQVASRQESLPVPDTTTVLRERRYE
jgi:hypothetical protein